MKRFISALVCMTGLAMMTSIGSESTVKANAEATAEGQATELLAQQVAQHRGQARQRMQQGRQGFRRSQSGDRQQMRGKGHHKPHGKGNFRRGRQHRKGGARASRNDMA